MQREARGARMRALLEEINPLQRMVNSPGMDRAFEIFKREFPDAVIHEYPAGMECEDWIVPRSWRVISGSMKNKQGDIIASIDESILFVAPYSEPVNGWFSKEEIEKHLFTREDRPNSFLLQHRHTYNYQLVDWGITLPFNLWEDLSEDSYHIEIDVDWGDGSMKVGEYFLPGFRDETICICAHIDELCNDDLSGCILGMELMRTLEQMPDRQYSYQLLWVPEMFGPLFFAHENPSTISNTIGMLNLEAVGAGEGWCMKKAWKPNTRLERNLRQAMMSTGVKFAELEFFEGYINDEKVYAWPTIDIQGVAIQRFPFPEYHTAEDVPGLIEDKLMLEALDFSDAFVRSIEYDYIPEYTKKLPPWLTRRGLYFDFKFSAEDHNKFNNDLLYSIDGKKSVLELSEKINISFDVVYKYLRVLSESGLISMNQVDWDEEY